MTLSTSFCLATFTAFRAGFICLGLLSIIPSALGSNIFRDSGSLGTARYSHTSTVLANGKILIAGGIDQTDNSTALAELFDPETETFSPTGSLATARSYHTSTLLLNGKVLVIGSRSYAPNEIYDPASGTWSVASPCLQTRRFHTATLLPDGQVLVAGGENTSSAELYDPVANTWSATGSLAIKREFHTATLLGNGKVLVVGGSNETTNRLNSAEIYDPASRLWSTAGTLTVARIQHTATLLADGTVLVVGSNPYGPEQVQPAEIFNPIAGLWSITGAPAYPRYSHTAVLLPDNTVLVSSGHSHAGNSAEIYHPETGTWSFAASLSTGRVLHTASLLANGSVLIIGGEGFIPGELNPTSITKSEIYVSIPLNWLETGLMTKQRQSHSTTVLRNHKVLVAGGMGKKPDGDVHPVALASTELYNPLTNIWENTGPMATARAGHQGVLLNSGKVLVVGKGAEIYDSQTGMWSSAGSFPADLTGCSATLLKDGSVLATGGLVGSAPNKKSYRYHPLTNSWSTTGSLSYQRAYHTATLLPDGKVFVHGGADTGHLSSCEIYDPETGVWSMGPDSPQMRSRHVAALLPSGKLLMAGGQGLVVVNNFWKEVFLDSAEIYDPASATWSFTGSSANVHLYSAGVALGDGRVLVTGGHSTADPENRIEGTNSTEIYDEGTQVWATTAPLLLPRTKISGVLLNDGRVLLAGGLGPVSNIYNGHSTNRAEIYDPVLPEITLEQLPEASVSSGETRSFGSVILGNVSDLKFAIRNTGTADLTGLSLTMDGTDAACFSVTASLSTSLAAPGEMVIFTVRFAPAAIGIKNAILHITSNDRNESPFDIRLTGSAYVPSPEIVVEQPPGSKLFDHKSKVSFGTVRIGTSGTAKLFTIKNTGTATLTKLAVVKVGADKGDFTIGALRKSALAPGSSTTFKVTFKPTAKGARCATIRIKSNDADENPFDINLRGMGSLP